MASSINHEQEYQQAQKAYIQGNYEEAATLADRLVQEFPDDPSSHLLRGHTYCVLQQYDLAREHYQSVLRLTESPELIDCANNALESISEYEGFDFSARVAVSKEIDADDTFGAVNSLDSFNDLASSERPKPQAPGVDAFIDPFTQHAAGASSGGMRQTQASELNDHQHWLDNTSGYGIENDAYDEQFPQSLEGNGFGFDTDNGDLDLQALEDTFGSVGRMNTTDESIDYRQVAQQYNFVPADELENSGDSPQSEPHPFAAQRSAGGGSGCCFEQAQFADSAVDSSSLEIDAIPLSLSDEEIGNESNSLLESQTIEDGVSESLGNSEAINNAKNTNSKSWLTHFENASLERKQWLTASSVGIVSAVVVAAVSCGGVLLSQPQERAAVRNTGWAMAAAAGIAGFVTTRFLGQLTFKQIQRTTVDLKTQFRSVQKGDFAAEATVHANDEFGQLASSFNKMARVILLTTSEARSKAEEQEQAKEELQRQVIRLLDDVEGAARGDLTVQAEVGADILGAVADSFNLTIQSLREIVQQVKMAARQVSKGATDSETFAQALSLDALRQTEELAATLSSVQTMTDAIQRVAESAREAESVARSASDTAKKGGEAVERTVSGILEIRQTVAETTRKVKRLAESSQEISKIVALISQIASRTNLLALNASIEAARAGEAGRGFAIVADEVRQLADRVGKALKEIEQIVRQIQGETGSVMTAMEEGTQQVIQGTHLAEQAKRSLEDIVQVSNRIDTLVRSITAETVKQTETSRAVASVMQSVEITAQENSQEAQRVSGSLQDLVGVAGNLLTSVERFRVETTELK